MQTESEEKDGDVEGSNETRDVIQGLVFVA